MNDLVRTLNGKAFTDSNKLAAKFSKSHDNVLKKVDSLIRNLTRQKKRVNDYFKEDVFINNRNREYRCFLMTRDGFVLLAMGFTGDRALIFQIQFIEAFNEMEAELKRQSILRLSGIETRKTLTDKIKDTGENERMHGHGYSTYTKLAYKLVGIKYKKPAKSKRFRDSLCPENLERLETVEDMIKSFLKAGKKYSEIKELVATVFTPRIEQK